MVSMDELELLHANICQALGDPKRIQILYALHQEPCNVSALAEKLQTPQPSISRHLAVLRERGLVKTERHGNMIVYSVSDTRIIDVLDVMRQLLRDLIAKRAKAFE
jgi:DNA-binding transcriptional ArsR family regulator